MLDACKAKAFLLGPLFAFCSLSSVAAQGLFDRSEQITISATGECSINIGILHSQLPSKIDCNNVAKEDLDQLLLLALTSGWESTIVGDLELFLPNTWRQVDDGMNGQFEAYPRSGTAFSDNQIQLYVPYGVGSYAYPRSRLGWDANQFAKYIGSEKAYHLELSDETYSAMIRSRLYVEEIISEAVNTDNDTLRVDYYEAVNFLSNNSDVIQIGGYPYCEGGTFAPDATRAIFVSIIPEEADDPLIYNLYIDRLSYFPNNFEGFSSWRQPSEIYNEYGDNYIFDFDQRPAPLMLSCRGMEITPGDVYTICSRILQQVSINNFGQFSC